MLKEERSWMGATLDQTDNPTICETCPAFIRVHRIKHSVFVLHDRKRLWISTKEHFIRKSCDGADGGHFGWGSSGGKTGVGRRAFLTKVDPSGRSALETKKAATSFLMCDLLKLPNADSNHGPGD